jgi:DnaJ-class molecular chaperone
VARRKRDYYVVLGVAKDATETDIKRAFRELARKHHPDVGVGDDGERFREINEAYAVLSDKDGRARYDRWGHADDSPGGLSAVVDAAQQIINDVFRRRRAQKGQGKDIRYTLEVSFEEAVFGATKKITLPPTEGSTVSREVTIVIPPGMKPNTVKTMKGDGEPGKLGGVAGDLVVMIRVAEHAVFERDGIDVRSEHAISITQAALGAVIDVPTLDGSVKMRIPEGTQPGRVFRIRSRGVPQAAGTNAPRGDHLVHIQVEVPTELSARQRELLEELARTAGEHDKPAPKKRLLDRVRSLLDE